MQYSVLVDVTRCIGCQGCQIACKSWNDRPAGMTQLGVTLGNPRDLDSNSYTVVRFHEEDIPGGVSWHFTKEQCMHCVDPACVAACPVNALTKDREGPVSYHKGLCIGCRYCMLACPFGVPKFEWERSLPYIQKCTFCAERIKEGVEPACTKACPSGTLVFGGRSDIVRLAQDRIASRPGIYRDHIYGLEEVGGTSWLYITDTEFENLYLREDLEDFAYGAFSWKALSKTPALGIGVAALLTAFYFIAGRKALINESDEGQD